MKIKDVFGGVVVFLITVGTGLLARGWEATIDTSVGLAMIAAAITIGFFILVRD